MDDPRPAGGRTREFDRRFDCLGAGIGEKDLVEMRRERQQPLGQQARKDRQIHLDEIGQIAVDHAVQGFAQPRMVAADREDAEAAEQIEIAVAGAVVEILSGAAAKADVEADRVQDAHHHVVHVAGMQAIALRLALGGAPGHVEARVRTSGRWIG